jgi:hypothetical protein
MYCSCLNQLSGQDEWERACGKAGEIMRGGRYAWRASRAGDVACSLRNTRTAKAAQLGSSRQLGMSPLRRHRTNLPVDTANIRSPVSRVFIAMGKLE